MQLQGFHQKCPEAPADVDVRSGGGRRKSGAPARKAAVRMRQGGKAAPVRSSVAGSLRKGCARVAERIRASTEVAGGDAASQRRAATGMPWVGLLLWALACAALLVSLIMRPDDLDRDRRMAARSEPRAPVSDGSYQVRDLTRRASEISLFTPWHTRPR